MELLKNCEREKSTLRGQPSRSLWLVGRTRYFVVLQAFELVEQFGGDDRVEVVLQALHDLVDHISEGNGSGYQLADFSASDARLLVKLLVQLVFEVVFEDGVHRVEGRNGDQL